MSAGHVFISHGSNDRDEATALSDFIEARGIRTWIAPRDVRPGQDYSEQLQQAIETCTAFVVLVTEKANSSPYVRAETEMAFSTSKPIFPVRRSDIQPAPGLAFFLKIRHWTDAFGKNGDAAMERLGLELETVCGVTPRAPAATTNPPAPAPAEPPPIPIPAPPSPPELRVEPPAPLPPLPSEQEARLRAAIGPKADWYLERWRRMATGGTWLSWNWPAFLATFFWFAYRRMWLPLAVAVGLFLLTDFAVSRDPGLRSLGWLFLLAIALAAGGAGNALYRRQVKRLVARADGLDQPVALAQIGAQGGISVPGLATSLGIFFLLFIATAVQQARMASSPAVQPPNGGAQAAQPNAGDQQGQAGGQALAQPSAPAAPAGGPTVDTSYIVGRWTSDGVCNSGFNADGSFESGDGSRGSWTLAGDRLTLTGNSTVTLQVVPVDANNMTLIQPDGSTIRASRC